MRKILRYILGVVFVKSLNLIGVLILINKCSVVLK